MYSNANYGIGDVESGDLFQRYNGAFPRRSSDLKVARRGGGETEQVADKSRLVKHNYTSFGRVERNAFNLRFMRGQKLSGGKKKNSG